ncbi:molybdopterin molybdenumtransferase MoeA [Dyella solisilvae]|uniref:Molybdopterin molybdenumtransferase n=1 Tax=Dyella solisilvae TaxID=1920168 RepID=A0A370K652_9GAMM|nr:gephyrin-like molybdotransferase Glp [Dyella solisilvae]RDI98126.1 molybdopterin molybdenumtransferase MoeA [Dyella solisilvae]
MINYSQALERLSEHVRPFRGEMCVLAEACGRVLAGGVNSPIDLPSFDHAAMDGYALRSSDSLAPGSEHVVGGSQAAGDVAAGVMSVACEIMTGAQLPEGLDTVVPVECTQLLAQGGDGKPARIRLQETVMPGANVRRAGSDVAAGARVLGAGLRIEPSHVMLLAALGVPRVEVARQPRVAIVCTGKELQPDLGQPLAQERIYNSNGPYLCAAVAAMGGLVLSCDTVDDTADSYAEAVQRAREAGADLIMSTGAVSMGRYDFVPDTLQRLGAELLFHKVAMRPGKPLLAARLDDGALVLALPGTPMAVAVGFRFFAVPVLRAMLGMGREMTWHANLETPQQPRPGLRHFLRATLALDAEGRLHATVAGPQQPFRIQPFADAGAWVILPEDAGECPAGTKVEIASLHPGQKLALASTALLGALA